MTETDTKAIKAVLKQMSRAYEERDVELMRATFTQDAFVLGPGVDEAARGNKKVVGMAERDWDQNDRTEIAFRRIHANVRGDVGYVDCECTFNVESDGQAMAFPARATFVLAKEAGTWRICQGHFSYPAANQPEGRSFPSAALAQA